MRPIRAGIPFAFLQGMWTDDERLEHQCRMGLLVVMVLHWIVFALLVTNSSSRIDASGAVDVGTNLGSLVRLLLLG